MRKRVKITLSRQRLTEFSIASNRIKHQTRGWRILAALEVSRRESNSRRREIGSDTLP